MEDLRGGTFTISPSLLGMKINKKKLNIKPKEIEQTSNIIPQILFKGTSVYVNISDEKLKNQVIHVMNNVGASIVENSMFLANIIISEKNISLGDLPKSVGSRNIAGLSVLPKVVLLKQIPWVLESPNFVHQEIIHTEPETPAPKIQEIGANPQRLVICDTFHKYRPDILDFTKRQYPKIYIQKTKNPKYTYSPFIPIPFNVDAVVEKINDGLGKPVITNEGPNDHGYCEICQTKFESAAGHHASFDHKRNAGSYAWNEFDVLASILFKKSCFCETQTKITKINLF